MSCSDTSSAPSGSASRTCTGAGASSNLAAPQPAQCVSASLGAPQTVHRKGSCTMNRLPVRSEAEPPVRGAWRVGSLGESGRLRVAASLPVPPGLLLLALLVGL